MKRCIIRVVLAMAALVVSVSANATLLTYEISQGGWTGGGSISGIFSGEDLDNDGYLNLVSGELSSYEVNFTGNSIIEDFSHDLIDLIYFRYTIGSAGFRPSYPLYSNDGAYFYDADDYVIASVDYSVWVSTSDNAIVRAVPLPSTFLLMMCLLLLPFINNVYKSKGSG